MTLVVKYLVLGAGDIDGLIAVGSGARILGLDLLCEVEDAGVSSLGDLPLEAEFEVPEVVGEDDVAALKGLAFSGVGSGELDGTVFKGPP